MIKRLKMWKIIVITLIAFLLYIIIGGVIPFCKQPSVTEDTIEEVKKTNYYGDDYISERVRLLVDNDNALEERIRMISQAQEKVILSTFQFYADDSGKAIFASLIDAANRGVEVQVIVDGVSKLAQFSDSKYFITLAETDNVELKVYNPISLLRPWSINGRLHDKYLLVDDSLYILGGRNIFGSFLGSNSDHKNHDLDVLVYNPDDTPTHSTKQLLEYFDEIWNNDYNKTVSNKLGFLYKKRIDKVNEELKLVYEGLQKSHPDWFESSDYYSETLPIKNIQLLTNPTTVYAKEPIVFYTISQLMQDGQKEISFHTPYIIANNWMMDELETICDKVPNVTMLTNSVANNGNPFGAVDYWQNKEDVLETGVNILEYDSGISYHGKCFTIDDRLSSVGSFNFDMRSTYIDTETMVVIDSEDFNEELRQAMKVYEEEALQVIDKDISISPQDKEAQKISLSKRLMLIFAGVLKIFFRFLF